MASTLTSHLKQSQKLHLGCGGFAPTGWINTDGSWHVWLANYPRLKKMAVTLGMLPPLHLQHPWPTSIIRLDLCQPLPLPDATLTAVYSSHVLEHLYRDEALALLQEVYRCCQIGGIIRMAVPHLGSYLTDYHNGLTSAQAPSQTAADYLIHRLHMRPAHAPKYASMAQTLYHTLMDFNSHKWLYDRDSLITLFQAAGFQHPQEKQVLDSAIRDINVIERPEHIGGGGTLIVEAVKEVSHE